MPRIDFTRKCNKCGVVLGDNDLVQCPKCGFRWFVEAEKWAGKRLKRLIGTQAANDEMKNKPGYHGPRFAARNPSAAFLF